MGSTIVTNRCAAVFENPENRGDHIWALFEQCYERNCYPHTPQWCARTIGRIDGAMETIFRDAACCEGGSLRDRSGAITPETYIRRWLRALRHPVRMPEMFVHLSEKDLRLQFRFANDETNEASWGRFRERMRALGREDIPHTLEHGGDIMLSLHQDVELVLAIYGHGKGQAPLASVWRAFGPHWAPTSAEEASIGYYPAGGEISRPETPEAYRIDDNTLVMRCEGRWRIAGWAYSAVGDYVRGLWEQELRAPGSYNVLIPPYRAAIEAAPALPRGSEAEVDLAVCPSYSKKHVYDLVEALGGRIERDPATGADAKVWLPWSVEGGLKLAYLPHNATTWHVPEAPEERPRLCA